MCACFTYIFDILYTKYLGPVRSAIIFNWPRAYESRWCGADYTHRAARHVFNVQLAHFGANTINLFCVLLVSADGVWIDTFNQLG